MKIVKSKLKEFEESLGGRVIYSATGRRRITLEYDYVLYMVVNKWRAKNKSVYFCCTKAKHQIYISGFSTGFFTCYVNNLVSRYYKIRKAIRESQMTYAVQ